MPLPTRERLHHDEPPWTKSGAVYFVTICCAPRGQNQLTTTPERSRAILDSVTHHHTAGTWWAHLFLLMPDHAHALLSISPGKSLSGTISAWKSWQAKTRSIAWQSGFFDHRLRSDESFEEKAHYIRQNPVRAGLVKRTEDWPHLWSPPA